MKLSIRQQVEVADDTEFTEGERHALEALWGVGSQFWVHLFQCFKNADAPQFIRIGQSFPSETKAFEDWEAGVLKEKMRAVIKRLYGQEAKDGSD